MSPVQNNWCAILGWISLVSAPFTREQKENCVICLICSPARSERNERNEKRTSSSLSHPKVILGLRLSTSGGWVKKGRRTKFPFEVCDMQKSEQNAIIGNDENDIEQREIKMCAPASTAIQRARLHDISNICLSRIWRKKPSLLSSRSLSRRTCISKIIGKSVSYTLFAVRHSTAEASENLVFL